MYQFSCITIEWRCFSLHYNDLNLSHYLVMLAQYIWLFVKGTHNLVSIKHVPNSLCFYPHFLHSKQWMTFEDLKMTLSTIIQHQLWRSFDFALCLTSKLPLKSLTISHRNFLTAGRIHIKLLPSYVERAAYYHRSISRIYSYLKICIASKKWLWLLLLCWFIDRSLRYTVILIQRLF